MGFILEEFEISGYRAVLNYKVDDLKKRVTFVGPNASNKSGIIQSLCSLGSNKMHENSDLPSWIDTSKTDIKQVYVNIKFLFKLTKNIGELISDDRIKEFLSLLYDYEINKTENETELDRIRGYRQRLKRTKPLGKILEDALYEAIRREVEKYPDYEAYKPLFSSKGFTKSSEDIFKEIKYLKVDLRLSNFEGPEYKYALLDKNRESVINDEVFFHMLNNQDVFPTDGDVTISLALGSTFIKGVVQESDEDVFSPKSVLLSDGSNLEQFVDYCLRYHPELLEEAGDYFEKVFGISINFKANKPFEVFKELVSTKLQDKYWFPLSKLSDGMRRALRIILQLASCRDGDIIVIDEPELHLHPGAVRRLRNLLSDLEKDIQVICSTHSPLFLDPLFAEEVILNHIFSNEPEKLSSAKIDKALSSIGTSGADVLLYDGAVWVEGPSDRVYLERWLELMEPRASQQIGVFFYGGKSQIEYVDVESLKNLCRNSVIIVDGDLKYENDSISSKALQFQSDCQRHGLYCWVIMRRSIENCIPIELIEDTLQIEHGTLNLSIYDDVIGKIRESGRDCEKMQLARAVSPKITLEHLEEDEELFNKLEDIFSKLVD